ncbi:MAG: reverse transcriptase domain-containing protein [Sedimenticola sp.]
MERNDSLSGMFLPEFIKIAGTDKVNDMSCSDFACRSYRNCKLCRAPGVEDLERNKFLLHVHEKVLDSGKYNFEGCRIRVNDKLNFEFLRHMLMGYPDKEVCDLLEFGFPLGCIGDTSTSLKIPKNHKGARQFPLELESYFIKEISRKTILGPFNKNPFMQVPVISPLNTVPKKDTTERRIILDLSFPKGNALNDTIMKDFYLGQKVSLVYPRVDDISDMIRIKGRHCLLFKKDLRKAFRQINLCPGDYHKVGYSFKGHQMFDTVLSMGLRSASQICQRVTNALSFIMLQVGVLICNYLDDLIGCEALKHAEFAYKTLEGILDRCGIEESVEKSCEPATRMTCLGILFDTVTMTLEVTPERLDEIRSLVGSWLRRTSASKKELQSLLGKLNFVSSCVRSSRIFVLRLLNFLREIYKSDDVQHVLPVYLHKDLLWWDTFLPLYNGISMIPMIDWSKPDSVLATDATLSGCGAVFGNLFFHAAFPKFILDENFSINALEMLSIVIALKMWGKEITGQRIVILCDNQSSCNVINRGFTRVEILQSCLREISFLAARFEFEVRARHISGIDNRLADHLSRWNTDDSRKSRFLSEFGSLGQECEVSDSMFILSDIW